MSTERPTIAEVDGCLWHLCLFGWACGLAVFVPVQVVGVMVGFVSGGVTINGIRDELPRSGEGRFTSFAMGSAVYSLLLLL